MYMWPVQYLLARCSTCNYSHRLRTAAGHPPEHSHSTVRVNSKLRLDQRVNDSNYQPPPPKYVEDAVQVQRPRLDCPIVTEGQGVRKG